MPDDYYFVVYTKCGGPEDGIIQNEIIDQHPLDFFSGYTGYTFLFWDKLSKEVYERHKDAYKIDYAEEQ